MKFNQKKRQRGQSLVETALFLPIFLIILAGVVEVSQLIVTKNRLTEAARATTRYGINGGDDSGMTLTALNTVSNTMDIDPARWDIWIIRGTVSPDGTTILNDSWQFEHTYGLQSTLSYTDAVTSNIKQGVLDNLEMDAEGDATASGAANLRFIGTYLQHDAESILGLGTLSSLIASGSIHDMSIMRFVGSAQVVTGGCEAFPIIIDGGARSVDGAAMTAFPSDFYDSSAKPREVDFISSSGKVLESGAPPGTIFVVYGSGNAGQEYSWVRWNDQLDDTAGNIIESLRWPGNNTDYNLPCVGCSPGDAFWGYQNPDNVEDRTLHIKDKAINATVGNATMKVNGVSLIDVIDKHINMGRTLRLMIRSNSESGKSTIDGFAIIKLHGHNLDADPPWMLIELIQYDSSCGQLTE